MSKEMLQLLVDSCQSMGIAIVIMVQWFQGRRVDRLVGRLLPSALRGTVPHSKTDHSPGKPRIIVQTEAREADIEAKRMEERAERE